MRFIETPLQQAYIIEIDKKGDERGFFARIFCVNEYDVMGLDRNIVQSNISWSAEKGTLRGLHYQLPPKAETKIVRCTHGALYDVILDIRPGSPTFGKWFGAELTAENYRMMLVPKGFAHGFLTLKANTEVCYFVTEFYAPERERGIRYNDPLFGIWWPFEPSVISPKDNSWRNFDFSYHLGVKE
jgi:dTDP-4-dehydrorhamnose 3,5-epimerase